MVVANDSVMDNSDTPSMVEMRMGIHISFVAVSGPPCVSNAYVVIMLGSALYGHALDAISSEPIRASKLSQDPLWFVFLVTRDRDYTTGVIASRFKDLKALDADRAGLWSVADVANDAAAFIFRILGVLHHLLVKDETSKHE